MKSDHKSCAAAMAVAALLAVAIPGCSKKDGIVIPVGNQKPTVRLTHAPVSSDSTVSYEYAYRMNWIGNDPDGRVAHFVYAVDALNVNVVDSTWVQTTKNEEIIFFTASNPDSEGTPRLATDPHVFTIRAVDDRGELSDPVSRAFYSFTVAPIVFVTSPQIGNFQPNVTPSVRIEWRGIDPDGVFTTKPVKYKFKLFRKVNPDFPHITPSFINYATSTPNAIRNLYAPHFIGWDSSSAETTEHQYTGLTPNEVHMFVVTGFDEAGAYDPIFTPTSNMLIFNVSFAGTLGPRITMFNEFFNYSYDTGGYVVDDPSRYAVIEVPANELVTFNWFADADPGASVRSYRWVLDLRNLDDETARTNPVTDWYHWSARSLNTTSARIGPFVADNLNHLFFIEAEDNNELRSLGIVSFTVVQSTLERELLIVDDTRLSADQGVGDELLPPIGPWPTHAELDTFFYARGGHPWKGYGGELSRPGVFNGYPFDTIGTKLRFPSGIVPLSVLGKYKRVIWYVDAVSATYTGSPIDIVAPISSLRLMSSRGFPSTISTYIKQGGLVWLFGGGGVVATLTPWIRTLPSEDFLDSDNEIVPGRFVWDFIHWRTRITAPRVGQRLILHSPGNVPGVPVAFNNPATIPSRGWQYPPERPPGYFTGTPSFSRLPLSLDRRSTPGTDPLDIPPQNFPPEGRTSAVLNFFTEFLTVANFIREDIDNDPATTGEESKLDTLYFGTGGTIGLPARPIMTLYRGHESTPVLFSGFPIWYVRRAHQIQLVDWVLQDLWKMPPRTASPHVSAASLRPRPATATVKSTVTRPRVTVSPTTARTPGE